ncbi:MAG TPA: threonine synthase, partial [Thermoleophilia bacterium]|nr:threonine synthase [Thermoleophilia bacterium]
MAAEKLRCKECGTGYPLDALYVCERCFGPLQVIYDHSALGDGAAARRRIQAARSDLWRYADFLPLAGGAPNAGLPAGATPLMRADRLAEHLGLRELWVK